MIDTAEATTAAVALSEPTPLWRAPLGCALVALALFLNTLPNELALDDHWIIKHNPVIRSLANTPEIFATSYWAAKGGQGGLYRPLTVFTYALNYAVGELNPWGYHAVNIVLHAVCTALVAFLALLLTRSPPTAWLAGMLFAAHPVHVEAVASVVGRAELLSTAFMIGAFLCYLRAFPAPGASAVEDAVGAADRSRLPAVASVLFYLAGMLCKETAITFIAWPAAYAVLVRCRGVAAGACPAVLRRERWLYAGYAAAATAYLLLRYAVIGGMAVPRIPVMDNPLADVSAGTRLLTAVGIVARYGWILVWPARLSADYGLDVVPVLASPLSGWFVVGALLLVDWLGLVAVSRRRCPVVAFLALAALAPYALVSNLVLVIGTPMAERLLYLPSVGLCVLAALALVWGLARWGPRAVGRQRTLLTVIAAVPVALLAGRTLSRNRDWRSDATLFLHDAAVIPRSAKLQYNAGWVHLRAGRAAEALPFFARALEVYPSFAKAYVHLGMAYGKAGDTGRHMEMYRTAKDRFPHRAWAIYAHGVYRMKQGDFAGARADFEQALKLDPRLDNARCNLGMARYNLRQYAAAAEVLRQPTRLGPADERNRLLFLARSLELSGQSQAALAAFHEGMQRFPKDRDLAAGAAAAAGRQLQSDGEWEAALARFEAAVKLDPQDRQTGFYAGLCCYRLKRYDATVAWLTRPLQLDVRAERNRVRMLGAAYEQTERFAQAADVYRAYLDAGGVALDILERLAYVEYTHLRDFDAALRHFAALLRRKPGHPRRASIRKAMQYMQQRRSRRGRHSRHPGAGQEGAGAGAASAPRPGRE